MTKLRILASGVLGVALGGIAGFCIALEPATVVVEDSRLIRVASYGCAHDSEPPPQSLLSFVESIVEKLGDSDLQLEAEPRHPCLTRFTLGSAFQGFARMQWEGKNVLEGVEFYSRFDSGLANANRPTFAVRFYSSGEGIIVASSLHDGVIVLDGSRRVTAVIPGMEWPGKPQLSPVAPRSQ